MLSSRLARAGLRASAFPRTSAVTTSNALRTYATTSQDIRPPIALYGVDGTYANALVSRTLCFVLGGRSRMEDR